MRHVSEIFDLERWARSIDKRLVEWKDVKDLRGLKGMKAYDQGPMADEQDEVGCWSVWATANLKEGKHNTASHLPGYLNLGESDSKAVELSLIVHRYIVHAHPS